MDDWYEQEHRNQMLLAEGISYSLDDFLTGLNNNVLVCAAPGRGKTRSVVIPNLLQAEGSYVVADPKGNLYGRWKEYLEGEGYQVMKLDFANPKDSIHYNPLMVAKTELDIMKLSHQLVYGIGRTDGRGSYDPFWDKTAEMLLCSVCSFVMESPTEKDKTLSRVIQLISSMSRKREDDKKSVYATKIEMHKAEFGETLAVRQYELLNTAPGKTYNTVCVCAAAELGKYTAPNLVEMMQFNDLDFSDLGKRKMVVFVVTSDTDRSMDTLASLFYAQLLHGLTQYADTMCPNQRLPVPVRFILDDFATNMRISDFPKIIASIRSRGISVMIMIQAEHQLGAMYGYDMHTIIGSCDTYVYLGNNDLDNVRAIAERAGKPIDEVLYMPLGKLWIFRSGEKPIYATKINYERFITAKVKNHKERK